MAAWQVLPTGVSIRSLLDAALSSSGSAPCGIKEHLSFGEHLSRLRLSLLVEEMACPDMGGHRVALRLPVEVDACVAIFCTRVKNKGFYCRYRDVFTRV